MKKTILSLLTCTLILSSGCHKKEEVNIKLSGMNYPSNLDYPIQPKPFYEVEIKDNFWKPKIKINSEVTIPLIIQKFSETKKPMSHNVLQAAIYSLKTYPNHELQKIVDSRIQEIKADQESSLRADNSFFEVAAAYYAIMGKRDLLDSAIKTANLIYDIQKTKAPPFSGGERDAINCLELYRVTHEKKYLDLAKYYLDIRGLENSLNRSRHNQAHKPVLEQTEAVGHAVNAASLMLSLADVGILTGIGNYFNTALRLWEDVVKSKLYIIGGIGSTGNEGFGEPYSLPNISAYCETCAAAMFAMFNHRLFLATGDSRYIDVMERAIYNNLLSGVSASGNRFFYVNRLASAGNGRDVRWEWASLPCCPPNLARFLASMPGYIYAQKKDEIYVNLYVSSDVSFRIKDKVLSLSIESTMPWGGKSKIVVSAQSEVEATLKLRIPGWARNKPVPSDLYSYMEKLEENTRVYLNGNEIPLEVDKLGYFSINRNWRNNDSIEIEFPFKVRKIVANQRVKAARGKMALERGPIVFCAEWPDCEAGHVLTLLLDPDQELEPFFDPEFFGGSILIKARAKNISRPSAEPKLIKLIPYYLWANRGPGEMAVWLSKEEYILADIGPAGGLIFYINPNYEIDGWRYLEAAPFDQSEGAPWGCFRQEIPGAQGRAVGTGKQNTLDIISSCKNPGTAADLCANFNFNGFSDWFLPSIDELTQIYLNLKLKGLGSFCDQGILDNFNYWSSTQASADMAYHLDFADNGLRKHYDDKDFPRRVRAIRCF